MILRISIHYESDLEKYVPLLKIENQKNSIHLVGKRDHYRLSGV